MTDFVAELGIVFLLFFLGLEFSSRPARAHAAARRVGGTIDLVVNAGLGLASASPRSGSSFGALILAGAIYVSSSAMTVKGLIDFRAPRATTRPTSCSRSSSFEDLVIGLMLGFAAAAAASAAHTLALVGEGARRSSTLSLAASRWLARPIDRLLDRLPREFFLLAAVRLRDRDGGARGASSASPRRSAR